MKIATYNILKGGSQRVHWVKLIEDYGVDILLVQESHLHDAHLPPLLYPDDQGKSVWEMADGNGWGSAIYSKSGSIKPVAVPKFSGWVVGAEVRGAKWQQSGIADPHLIFSVHARAKGQAYTKQVNRILDEIAQIAGSREIVVGGDFKSTVSNPASNQDATCCGVKASTSRAAAR
jgi:exonuclease III